MYNKSTAFWARGGSSELNLRTFNVYFQCTCNYIHIDNATSREPLISIIMTIIVFGIIPLNNKNNVDHRRTKRNKFQSVWLKKISNSRTIVLQNSCVREQLDLKKTMKQCKKASRKEWKWKGVKWARNKRSPGGITLSWNILLIVLTYVCRHCNIKYF